MRRLCTLLLALALFSGCDEEPIQVGRSGARPVAPVGPASDPAAATPEEPPDAGPQQPQYRDEDFAEADTNRDPFRNYAAMFQAAPRAAEETTREVEMPNTGIDEMRVIAIVTGVADPRAMIVDREGVGHVVRRGSFLGRAEIVQAGGLEELPVTLHWRVDRIRGSEVVLTRDDPTAPNRPPLTRVLPLREEAEELSLPTPR
jgi:type IV pilus assembly protein PilP